MRFGFPVHLYHHYDSDPALAAAIRQLSLARRRLAQAVSAYTPIRTPHGSTKEMTMANPLVQETITEVTDAVGVMQSATVLISGFGDMLQAAKDEAVANGATEAQLAPFAQLKTELSAAKSALAAAVAANPKNP